MATEAEPSDARGEADRMLLGLLARLAPAGGCDFLPDVPSRKLLSVLSCYHRRPTRVGFPETGPARA